MDTNQETGVSLADVADLIPDETETVLDQPDQVQDEGVQQLDQPEGEQQQAEDEFEEVSIEGKTYKVPKELKDGYLKASDYTQKTQALADQRREIQERAQLLEHQTRAMTQAFDQAVQVREAQNRLAQFEQINWQELIQADSGQAMQLQIAYQQAQRDLSQKQQALQQAQGQVQQLTSIERQQLLTQAQKDLKERIPDFGPQVAEQISAAAREYGITDAELKAISEERPDARFVHVLHDAMKWRALQAQKPNAMQKVAAAPKAVIRPQAARSPQQRTNQAALDRLKNHGRIEDLANFL